MHKVIGKYVYDPIKVRSTPLALVPRNLFHCYSLKIVTIVIIHSHLFLSNYTTHGKPTVAVVAIQTDIA